ncbi:hypothetical protein J0895_10490, partial [Phormidium pseudopriestleyi FRX01]
RVRASPFLGEWGWWGMRADCPNIRCSPLKTVSEFVRIKGLRKQIDLNPNSSLKLLFLLPIAFTS